MFSDHEIHASNSLSSSISEEVEPANTSASIDVRIENCVGKTRYSYPLELSPQAFTKTIKPARLSLPSINAKIFQKPLPPFSQGYELPVPHFEDPYIERLYTHLKRCCRIKWGEALPGKQVLNTALSLIGGRDSQKHLRLILSQLINLVDKRSNIALAITRNTNLKEIQKKIKEFSLDFKERAYNRIEAKYQKHVLMGYPNAELEKYRSIVTEISRILISQSGLILDYLIPMIQKAFLKEDHPLCAHIKVGLDQLLNSDELKKKIEKIKRPKSPHSNESLIIQATLQLSSIISLKDYHAKRAALSAFLTHLRQGHIGSCFASFLAIDQQMQDPLGSVADFQELLAHGGLSRNCSGNMQTFPFLLKMNMEKDLDAWGISNEGTISYSEAIIPLWEIPETQNMCHFLNIPAEETVLSWLEFEKAQMKSLTVADFINNTAKTHQYDEDRLRFVFSSSTKHPLLTAWVNSIAGMAEGANDSMIKSALVNFVRFFAKKAAKKNGFADFFEELKLITIIEKEVLGCSHYLYDPSLPNGAFILFEGRQGSPLQQWRQITSETDFKDYLRSVIKKTLSFEHPKCTALQNALFQEIAAEEMFKKMLGLYNKENTQENPLTPWAIQAGNDPRMVLKIYNQLDELAAPMKIYPSSADELLQELFIILQKEKASSVRKIALPIRIKGVHVFSLLVAHPDLVSLAEGQEKPPVLLHPISQFVPSTNMREQLFTYATTWVKKKHAVALLEKCKTIPNKALFHKLRADIMTHLLSFLPPFTQKAEIEQELDKKMIELLPQDARKMWELSILHVADTNWHDNVNDIHYGIGINPGSGKTEVIGIIENGKLYKFYNQDQFFKGQTWEIYPETRFRDSR